ASLQVLARLVHTAHAPIGHRERVLNRRCLRHAIEDRPIVFDGLSEFALAHRDVAKTTARDRGEDIDDALKLIARVYQTIEAHVDVAEIDGGGMIAWLQPARRSERLGRFLEPPGLLIQDAEQMRPLAVSRRE